MLCDDSSAAEAGASKITILNVLYKGQDNSGDFTYVLIRGCKGKQSCQWYCSNEQFSDVDEGHEKSCYVRYRCGQDVPVEVTELGAKPSSIQSVAPVCKRTNNARVVS